MGTPSSLARAVLERSITPVPHCPPAAPSSDYYRSVPTTDQLKAADDPALLLVEIDADGVIPEPRINLSQDITQVAHSFSSYGGKVFDWLQRGVFHDRR